MQRVSARLRAMAHPRGVTWSGPRLSPPAHPDGAAHAGARRAQREDGGAQGGVGRAGRALEPAGRALARQQRYGATGGPAPRRSRRGAEGLGGGVWSRSRVFTVGGWSVGAGGVAGAAAGAEAVLGAGARRWGGARVSSTVRLLSALRRRCDIAGKRLSGPGPVAEGRVLRAVLYVYHSRLLRHRPYLALRQVSTNPAWAAGTRQLGTPGPQKKPVE